MWWKSFQVCLFFAWSISCESSIFSCKSSFFFIKEVLHKTSFWLYNQWTNPLTALCHIITSPVPQLRCTFLIWCTLLDWCTLLVGWTTGNLWLGVLMTSSHDSRKDARANSEMACWNCVQLDVYSYFTVLLPSLCSRTVLFPPEVSYYFAILFKSTFSRNWMVAENVIFLFRDGPLFCQEAQWGGGCNILRREE